MNRETACVFLRCKQDAYVGDDPDRVSEVPRVWWCGKTLGSFGPDEDGCGIEECQPGRSCYSDQVGAVNPSS